MGGRERANLTRPRRARLTAATMSRSITILQFPHQSLRSSRLSDWSLSPHLGQVTLEPLVSRLDKRITGSPPIGPCTLSVAEPLRNSTRSSYPDIFYPDRYPSGRGIGCPRCSRELLLLSAGVPLQQSSLSQCETNDQS